MLNVGEEPIEHRSESSLQLGSIEFTRQAGHDEGMRARERGRERH